MKAAAHARKLKGFTVEDVAKKLRLRPGTIRQYECSGCDCYETALELSTLYGCKIEFFLYPRQHVSTPERVENRQTGTAKDNKRA